MIFKKSTWRKAFSKRSIGNALMKGGSYLARAGAFGETLSTYAKVLATIAPEAGIPALGLEYLASKSLKGAGKSLYNLGASVTPDPNAKTVPVFTTSDAMSVLPFAVKGARSFFPNSDNSVLLGAQRATPDPLAMQLQQSRQYW